VNSNFAGAILIFSDYHLPVDLVDLIDSLDLGAFCAVPLCCFELPFRELLPSQNLSEPFAKSHGVSPTTTTPGDQQALQQGRPIGPANWQLVP
jgi:hypothetical protein